MWFRTGKHPWAFRTTSSLAYPVIIGPITATDAFIRDETCLTLTSLRNSFFRLIYPCHLFGPTSPCIERRRHFAQSVIEVFRQPGRKERKLLACQMRSSFADGAVHSDGLISNGFGCVLLILIVSVLVILIFYRARTRPYDMSGAGN